MTKRKKKKLTPEEKTQKKFSNKIRDTFKNMGFEYIRSMNIHPVFGGQRGEFDSIFIHENIILLIEDTITQDVKHHLKGKHVFFEQVQQHKKELLSWLNKTFPDKMSNLQKYDDARYYIFFIYVHKTPIEKETQNIYEYIHFVNEYSLEYFARTAKCIKKTAMNEIFKFLKINLSDVGSPSSSQSGDSIETAVILPEGSSGFPPGIKVVNFLISANSLMSCSYVLRKESWEDNSELYQRLLINDKIQSMRDFLIKNKKTFINNIIVSLPDDVTFHRKSPDGVKITIKKNELSTIENLVMEIPNKINTIGIIDGQHRVFAHYYDKTDNEKEKIISRLRKDRHLLATGLVYPKTMRSADRVKFESELFLQINSTQKKPDTALLQEIEALKDPYSSIGIARKVLRKLNERSPFLNLFQIYSFEKNKIKTPSITKWGLSDLVEINNDKETLFKYWNKTDKLLLLESIPSEHFDVLFNEYLEYCAISISTFFKAVKENYRDDWTMESDSILISVTPITGFLIGFRKSLEKYKKVQDFSFYKTKLSQLSDIEFKPKKFPYISSHWHHFADQITEQCWN